MATKQANMRFDDETNKLIDRIREHIGGSRTGAVKYAVRETVRQLETHSSKGSKKEREDK